MDLINYIDALRNLNEASLASEKILDSSLDSIGMTNLR